MGTDSSDFPGISPSGLFPSGPPRPTYREAHRVRTVPVLVGAAAGGAWLGVFALLGHDVATRVWWTVAAGAVAWLAALLLAVRGDRGVAVGLAVAVGAGGTLAGGAVGLVWLVTTDWPLW